MSILEGELAADISAGLLDADIPYDVTLLKRVVSGPPHDPDVSYVPHACKGFAESYDANVIDGTLIQVSDRKVMVLASSLDIVPTPADSVTVDGESYAIMSVKTDPAGAIFELQARV